MSNIKQWSGWSRGRGPDCARPALIEMFAAMEAHAARHDCRPIELVAAMAHDPPPGARTLGNFFVVVEVRFAPGPPTRSFASWWAWQHPRFHWAGGDFPAIGLGAGNAGGEAQGGAQQP